jgi:hypothetical protein
MFHGKYCNESCGLEGATGRRRVPASMEAVKSSPGRLTTIRLDGF